MARPQTRHKETVVAHSQCHEDTTGACCYILFCSQDLVGTEYDTPHDFTLATYQPGVKAHFFIKEHRGNIEHNEYIDVD